MANFTTEEKIQIVLRYLKGNESINAISKETKASNSAISEWIRLFKEFGEHAFIKSYTSYSVEFKLNVLNYMKETGTTSRDAATIFNISSSGMIRSWRKAFEAGGIDALQPKKKGRKSMKKEIKSKNVQQQPPVEGSLEALQAENERLRMENAYLKKLNALVQDREKLQTKSKRK
jgi:transposase